MAADQITKMNKYAACVEYDGSAFSGWQAQKHDVRTVQEVLEKALSKVANEPVSIITAGRTDARVHATHQVVHFETDVERTEFSWCRGTNRFLDEDVRVHWVHPVDDEFHARFGALTRSYRFIINNAKIPSALFRHCSTHEYLTLKPELMREAGKLLIGTHDFSSFRAAGCQANSPIRTLIDFELYTKDEWIWFDVRANAFLQHMIRNIAGTLIDVGSGERDLAWMAEVLAAKDRTKAGTTAKPNGLYLMGVEYPEQYQMPTSNKLIGFWSD